MPSKWMNEKKPFKCPKCGDVVLSIYGHLTTHHLKLTYREKRDIIDQAYSGLLTVKNL